MDEKIIKKVYSAWSKTYDEEDNPALYVEEKYYHKLFTFKPEEKVLDIGCGTGRTIHALKDKCQIEGCDISEEMLIVARRKNPNVKFKNQDISKGLEYKEKEFHSVLCSFVISHLKNIDFLFKEISRILKSNGRLILSTIHPEADFSSFELREDKIRFKLMKYDINMQHDIEAIKKSLEKASFKIETLKEANITQDMEYYYTDKSFKKIKGKKFIIIISALKKI